MLTLDSRPKINANVVATVVDAEAVVVHPVRGKVNVFNEVGTFIWERADGARSVRQIAAEIGQEFEVTVEQAQADALAFLADLLDREIISIG